ATPGGQARALRACQGSPAPVRRGYAGQRCAHPRGAPSLDPLQSLDQALQSGGGNPARGPVRAARALRPHQIPELLAENRSRLLGVAIDVDAPTGEARGGDLPKERPQVAIHAELRGACSRKRLVDLAQLFERQSVCGSPCGASSQLGLGGELAGRDQRDESSKGDRRGCSDLRGIADQKAARDRDCDGDPDHAGADHGRLANSCSTRWSEASASSRSPSVTPFVLKRASSKRSVSAAAAPALTRSRRMALPRNSLAVSSRARTISTSLNACSIRE